MSLWPITTHLQTLRLALARSSSRAAILGRSTDGMSAVEFALFAPVLVFGLLATVDVGLALHERMTIDHVLRAGVQQAVGNPGTQKVLDVMQTTGSRNFSVSATEPASDGALLLGAERYHACANDPGMKVVSTTICSGNKPSSIYYRLTGKKGYVPMIIPKIAFDRAVLVQVR